MDAQDKDGWTALFEAARQGRSETAAFLARAGASLSCNRVRARRSRLTSSFAEVLTRGRVTARSHGAGNRGRSQR